MDKKTLSVQAHHNKKESTSLLWKKKVKKKCVNSLQQKN
jgi:hypothetical protein